MKHLKLILAGAFAALLLTGCSMTTVDEMYCIPKRSERFAELQSVIDSAMSGLEYCAPRSGENQQTVQMADLDGDGQMEYLVFTKGFTDKPMRILIFDYVDKAFRHVDSIDSNGSGFDRVEYIQMDDTPGLELVVGHKVGNQVPRSVSVYSFASGHPEQILITNYSKMLTVDLDMDNFQELFILRPGQSETDKGIAELYGLTDGVMERSNEVTLSGPVDKVKRMLLGQLHDGESAVYIASSLEQDALITDVFSYINEVLVNVSVSNESGTSVKTMRNFYVFSDDIDNDGVVELPDLITMKTLDNNQITDRHDLIRWYAMTAQGEEVDKMFTFHDFMAGWYLELDEAWASRLTVQQSGNEYAFFIWTEDYDKVDKIVTIFANSPNTKEVSESNSDAFTLLKTDSFIYTARLEVGAAKYDISRDSLIRDFHRIQQEWKTGET